MKAPIVYQAPSAGQPLLPLIRDLQHRIDDLEREARRLLLSQAAYSPVTLIDGQPVRVLSLRAEGEGGV